MTTGFCSAIAGQFPAFDRYGRTLQQQWKKGSTVQDQVDYAYDYAGNRLSRSVTGAAWLDQAYTYDGLHRLKTVDESTAGDDRYWSYDQLGNWEEVYHNTTGTGTAYQTRTHNEVNELETISNWQNPAHDAAGNLTTIPQPLAPGSSYTLAWDAWNRLVQVEDPNGTTVAANQYDRLVVGPFDCSLHTPCAESGARGRVVQAVRLWRRGALLHVGLRLRRAGVG